MTARSCSGAADAFFPLAIGKCVYIPIPTSISEFQAVPSTTWKRLDVMEARSIFTRKSSHDAQKSRRRGRNAEIKAYESLVA